MSAVQNLSGVVARPCVNGLKREVLPSVMVIRFSSSLTRLSSSPEHVRHLLL